MTRSAASLLMMTCALIFGCASQPPLDEALQPRALSTAQQRGQAELACPAATARVLSKQAIQEAQATGWYEPPHRAEYTIDVAGCGKRAAYSVGCDKAKSTCEAAPVSAAPASVAPRQLADELQPDAISAAQQRGSKELSCANPTAEVKRKDTIEEGQTTGWYEPPHRAVYAVAVAGCGQQTAYLVECDKRQKTCATGRLLASPAKAEPPGLAEELQPGALQAAQQQASQDFACSAVTAEVKRKETIEEGQTTGWYQPPYRALYTVAAAGCDKQATYMVACNNKMKSCSARPLPNR